MMSSDSFCDVERFYDVKRFCGVEPFTTPRSGRDRRPRQTLTALPIKSAVNCSARVPHSRFADIERFSVNVQEALAAEPLRRFRYHFSGSRPTAKPERPEWPLNWVRYRPLERETLNVIETAVKHALNWV